VLIPVEDGNGFTFRSSVFCMEYWTTRSSKKARIKQMTLLSKLNVNFRMLYTYFLH